MGQRSRQGVSTAILFRDAARTSRRWQNYALRTGFSAALLALVLASIWAVTNIQQLAVDPSDMGRLGRYIFIAFAVIQVLLATVIAPFGVAQAIIEERDEATMDLLALTYLSPRQILGAKVTGRVLTLLTVILGALPVLGMVVSLGGVSVVEVISVTTHAMLTVVLLGTLGGFFALFTRSPVLATLASLGYAAFAFIGMPLLYGFLVLDWRAFAEFSPLMGTTATNWWAMLPVLSYLPVVLVTFVLGSRLFALRIARARIRRYFAREIWSSTGFAILWGVLGITLLVVVPPAVIAAWFAAMSKASPAAVGPVLGTLVGTGAKLVLWPWCVALLVACTWLYLRFGMDLVMIGDDLITGRTTRKNRIRRGKDLWVWSNPVLWRSLRPAAMKVIVPMVTLWMLVLLAVFQTGLWVIPGGLLTIGGLNAVATYILTLWLAASAVDEERRSGTLPLLLTTTLSTWRIVVGKLAGVAGPSFPLLCVSYPLILLGVPHLHMVQNARSLETVMVVGVLACGWITAVWLFTMALTLFLAMWLRNSRAAQPLAMGVAGSLLGIPPVIVLLLTGHRWLAEPFRLMVPVLTAQPAWWEVSLSSLAWGFVGLCLLLLTAFRLRAWGSR